MEHTLRFFESRDALVDRVAAFIEEGVVAGEAALLITDPDFGAEVERALEDNGVDLGDVQTTGRYVRLDSDEILDAVSPENGTDPRQLSDVVSRTFGGVDGDRVPVRVFCHPVSTAGDIDRLRRAMRLESLWNELLLERPMRLLCAYDLALFGDEEADSDFSTVCDAHSTVVPAESYPNVATDEERLRAVASLQRERTVLERERVLRSQAQMDNALLASIVESSEDAIVSKDLDGIITSWNRRAEQLFGYTADEVVGRPVTVIIPDDRVDEEAQILARIRRGESIEHFETLRQRKDGTLLPISLTISPIRDRSGRVVGASKVARDISKRVRAEREVRRLADRYGRLAGLLPVGVYSCDATGVITYCNDSAAQVWGRRPPKGVFQDAFFEPFRIFGPDGETPIPYVRSPMAIALHEGRACRNANIVLEHPDGTRVRLLVNVDVVRDQDRRVAGTIGVLNDISALERAETELRDQKVKFQGVLDTVPVAVLLAHDAEGRRISGNRAASELLRMPLGANLSATPSPGAGRPPFRVLRDGQPIPGADLPIQRAAKGETVLAEDVDIVYDDGTTVHALVFARPLLDEAERPRGAVGSILDVTALKASERALKESDRRKDEFLATLSHELRNPLAAIVAGFEALKTVGEESPTGRGTLETMEGQTRQLTRLVDDLMDVSRIASGKLTLRRRAADLGAVIGEAVEAILPTVEAMKHTLTVDTPDPPVTVDVDPERLTQILSNLLSNAAVYTPPGGGIELNVARVDGWVSVSVTDDGIGIEDHDRERIFEMFGQAGAANEDHAGLGVGLALARSLVELHGGTLQVHSAGRGAGSTFTVRLPVPPGISFEEESNAGASVPEPTKGHRVLVVDDNEAFAEAVSIVIETLGHEVRTAHDGGSAIELAEEFRPDVILMDLGMPGLNGYDAARAIRDRPWSVATRLVAVTGWGQEEVRLRTREAGFDDHLVKPAHPDDLRRLLAF